MGCPLSGEWRKTFALIELFRFGAAAAHGHVRSGGAGSTGVRNTGVKSLAGGQIARSQGSSLKLPPSRLPNSRRSCQLLVLRPGFADVAERPAVHDWKFATRVEWLNGH
jgi:hypothetical protein